MPAQLAELGSAVEELSARTEAPAAGWARSEVANTCSSSRNALELERDVRTGDRRHGTRRCTVVDARRSDASEVRRLLAAELGARAVPCARPATASRAHHGGGAGGGPASMRAHLSSRGAAPRNGWQAEIRDLAAQAAAGRGLARALLLRRVDPGSATLVTQEAESLRRQHLERCCCSARAPQRRSRTAPHTWRRCAPRANGWFGTDARAAPRRRASARRSTRSRPSTSIRLGQRSAPRHRRCAVSSRGRAATP